MHYNIFFKEFILLAFIVRSMSDFVLILCVNSRNADISVSQFISNCS